MEVDYIDCSGLSTYARCPFKWYCSRVLGLSKPDRPMIAMDYGTCMHAALPFCYTGNPKAGIAKFNELWDAFGHGEEDEKRNKILAAETIRNFTDVHKGSLCPYEIVKLDIKAPTADTVHEDEVPFLIDIGGHLPLAGRIDVPVRYKSTGDLWALDYKTSGEISARYFNNFHFAPQACGYTLALAQMTGENVRGMIVEAIRVSKVRAESQLSMVFIQQHQLEAFIQWANTIAESIIDNLKADYFPKSPSGCGSYAMFGFPGFYCEYQMLCDMPNWKDGLKFFQRAEPYHPFKIKKVDSVVRQTLIKGETNEC